MLDENVFFKRDQRYVILDTESNGLNLVNGKPFQLSWILATRDTVLERHDEFILFDDLNMSDGAAKITKFDKKAYLAKAKSPAEVYKKFASYLMNPQYIIVCQNFLNFDCYMIKNLQIAAGQKVDYSYLDRCIDTRILFIAIQKNIKYGGDIPFLDWQYKVSGIYEKGLKSSQLHMLNFFEIPFEKEKLHEALYDITMLYEILKCLLMKIEVPDLTKVRP